jgi:hypothetical protein
MRVFRTDALCLQKNFRLATPWTQNSSSAPLRSCRTTTKFRSIGYSCSLADRYTPVQIPKSLRRRYDDPVEGQCTGNPSHKSPGSPTVPGKSSWAVATRSLIYCGESLLPVDPLIRAICSNGDQFMTNTMWIHVAISATNLQYPVSASLLRRRVF